MLKWKTFNFPIHHWTLLNVPTLGGPYLEFW